MKKMVQQIKAVSIQHSMMAMKGNFKEEMLKIGLIGQFMNNIGSKAK
jgi:hypothetical protein